MKKILITPNQDLEMFDTIQEAKDNYVYCAGLGAALALAYLLGQFIGVEDTNLRYRYYVEPNGRLQRPGGYDTFSTISEHAEVYVFHSARELLVWMSEAEAF